MANSQETDGLKLDCFGYPIPYVYYWRTVDGKRVKLTAADCACPKSEETGFRTATEPGCPVHGD